MSKEDVMLYLKLIATMVLGIGAGHLVIKDHILASWIIFIAAILFIIYGFIADDRIHELKKEKEEMRWDLFKLKTLKEKKNEIK